MFVGHLHFDHGGGLCDMAHAEIHVHEKEMDAAHEPADEAYFANDFTGDYRWKMQASEYDLVGGVRAIESPGHTAGHMSMLIELPKGPPILLAGDAADLEENLQDEVAPGLCWHDREELALASIRKLKQIARRHRCAVSGPIMTWLFIVLAGPFRSSTNEGGFGTGTGPVFQFHRLGIDLAAA